MTNNTIYTNECSCSTEPLPSGVETASLVGHRLINEVMSGKLKLNCMYTKYMGAGQEW